MRDIFIEITGTTVYGKTAGDPDKPLILALHGWSQRNGWQTWEPLIDPLAEAGYYVVSIDIPGWGKSPAIDPAPLTGPNAEKVVLELIEGLKRDSAVLMGKSWGGGIAVKLAVDKPNRVSHLILTAPALRNFDQLKSLRQPVLLAWAEDDPVIPFSYAERFISYVPQTIFISYPTGGHSAAPKNAGDFAGRAADFLKKSRIAY